MLPREAPSSLGKEPRDRRVLLEDQPQLEHSALGTSLRLSASVSLSVPGDNIYYALL